MADYSARTVVITRREWTLDTEPYATAIGEVEKAIAAAETQYQSDFGHTPTFDDWLRVRTEDNLIVFYYETKAAE
jgi:hypothetical protein